MGRYKVVIGRDFEVEAFELECVGDVNDLSSISAGQARSRMQERLTYFLLGGIVLALIVALIIGVLDGSYDEVGLVWSASALPLGYILKSYFEVSVPP